VSRSSGSFQGQAGAGESPPGICTWLSPGAAAGKIPGMTRALTVIGVPCSAGAHHGGLERGPAALRGGLAGPAAPGRLRGVRRR
jgi:hypothetical protein